MKKRRRFCMPCKNLLLFFVEKMGYLIEKDRKGQGVSIFTSGRNFPFVCGYNGVDYGKSDTMSAGFGIA